MIKELQLRCKRRSFSSLRLDANTRMLLAAFAARARPPHPPLPPPPSALLNLFLDFALFELLLELLKRDDGDCVVQGVLVLITAGG